MIIDSIIPARSGSKRIKGKNITKFYKLPHFYHSIYFAKKISDNVYLYKLRKQSFKNT